MSEENEIKPGERIEVKDFKVDDLVMHYCCKRITKLYNNKRFYSSDVINEYYELIERSAKRKFRDYQVVVTNDGKHGMVLSLGSQYKVIKEDGENGYYEESELKAYIPESE